MIYIISLTVFLGIILFLVAILLIVEIALMKKGDRFVVINDDDSNIKVKRTPTLLSALTGNGILSPSACGNNSSCGMCKCVVKARGDIQTDPKT